MDKVVFTNGCFDIIHPGHIDLLNRAKELGTRLIVGINSDASVRAIKGPGRPINDQETRKAVLLGLKAVDDVVIFDETTPEDIIREVKPDVLVKGGDWKIEEIIGADTVQARGGQVFSLPLKDGFSTSKIIAAMDGEKPIEVESRGSVAEANISEHLGVFEALRDGYAANIEQCAEVIAATFEAGKKVMICGNGGSAADAQHMAAEFVGRYESDRRGLPAIALTTDTSALTALSNDFEFTNVFARQVNALATEGDCLIAISTSGTSPNIIAAVMAARKLGCKVIGMTGANGKKLASLCDACILVPSERTSRIQEAHITIAHIWCEIIDSRYTDKTV
jgi:D-sedoheptulose 7-phosphate isomerase